METIIGTFYKDRVVLVLFWLLYFPILTSSNIAYLSGWKSVVRTPGPGTLDSWNWSVLAGLRPGPGRLRGIEAQFYILCLPPPAPAAAPAPPGPAAPPLSGARQSEAGRGGEQSSTAAVCRDNTAVSRVRTGARTQWQIAVWPGHLPAPAPCPAPSCEQHRCAGLVSSADPGPSTRPRLSVVSSCLAFVWSRRQPHQDTVHHSPVLARPQPRLQVGWLGHSVLLGGLSQRLRPTYLTWMALELELVSLTSHHTPSLTFVCFRFQLSQCWAACEEGSPPKWT